MKSAELAGGDVLLESEGFIRRLTLNRPDRMNGMSREMIDALVESVESFEADPTAKVVIIGGSGAAFSAGYDIGGTRQGPGFGNSRPAIQTDIGGLLNTARSWDRIWNSRLPVIAQVHGYCLAGGTDLAQHCDIVIVADDAQIAFPPVRAHGSPPTSMWLYNVGPQWAKRLLLTGDRISGRTAERIGFALKSVPADALTEEVESLAERMSHVGRDLLIGNKFVLNQGVELMGRRVLQNMAATQDTIAHLAPEATPFWSIAESSGLREAFDHRDSWFRAGEPL